MTTHFRRAAAVALALTLAACGGDKPGDSTSKEGTATTQVAPPAGQDWTTTIAATPEGGFMMGNPNAPVKLVEYASLTCPHCAEFSEKATEPLKAEFIKTGKVSWEFRPFVLNPVDVAGSLLLRCQGAAPVFKLLEQLYAEQKVWGANLSAMGEAEYRRIGALPPEQQLVELAKAATLDQFFRARGLPSAKADQCIADKAATDQLVAIRERGTKQDGVTGTPSFLINGTLADGVYDWTTLQARLRSEVGG